MIKKAIILSLFFISTPSFSNISGIYCTEDVSAKTGGCLYIIECKDDECNFSFSTSTGFNLCDIEGTLKFNDKKNATATIFDYRTNKKTCEQEISFSDGKAIVEKDCCYKAGSGLGTTNIGTYIKEQTFKTSYDCEKAYTKSEIQICHSENLSKLDLQMNSLYKEKIKALSDTEKQKLQATQKEWIKKLEACEFNRLKISDLYKKRIQELEEIKTKSFWNWF